MNDMRVKFRDLRVTDDVQRHALLSAVERVLRHGILIMGPEVVDFERRIAAFCGTGHCVGVSSGTNALYLALKALRIGPGDEVITTPLSWIATLNAIHFTGATAVFVDIADDLNINATEVAAAVTRRTRAILPVHYNGRLCDMDVIMATARQHDLLVLEDAAQAFGAEWNGRRAGSFGTAGALSLNPMKVFCGYGEAGAITFDHPLLVERLGMLRYLGTVNKETCIEPELNHKIDPIQAAMLMVSLDYLPGWLAWRHSLARRYVDRIGQVVRCPDIPTVDDRRSTYFNFTIQTERRDALAAFLREQGIETAVKHRVLMPDQPAYAGLSNAPLPVARAAVDRILSLPLHEKLSFDEVDYVCDRVEHFFGCTD